MAEKPGNNEAHASQDKDKTDAEPGRLGMDDRGNVTWEWNETGDLNADDSLGAAERVRVLVDPGMDVLDDPGTPDNPRVVNPKLLKTGYNPYDSGALGKQTWKKKKNLQELSRWIDLRKKLADKTDDE
jgi:hypothetical protein